MAKQDDYWFETKRYGWGWGMPKNRQGWTVLLIYSIVVVLLSGFGFSDPNPTKQSILLFSGGMLMATIALIAICLKKGEKPQWSWGKKHESKR